VYNIDEHRESIQEKSLKDDDETRKSWRSKSSDA